MRLWLEAMEEPSLLSDGQLLGAFALCLLVIAGLLVSVYVGFTE